METVSVTSVVGPGRACGPLSTMKFSLVFLGWLTAGWLTAAAALVPSPPRASRHRLSPQIEGTRQRQQPALPAAVIAAVVCLPPSRALAIGGDGFGDGPGALTGTAWVDGLLFLSFCGTCGLLYLTTLDDFGQ